MVNSKRHITSQIARLMGSTWGPPGAHLGPASPRWAPCWPHKSCYQGWLRPTLLAVSWAVISCPKVGHCILDDATIPWPVIIQDNFWPKTDRSDESNLRPVYRFRPKIDRLRNCSWKRQLRNMTNVTCKKRVYGYHWIFLYENIFQSQRIMSKIIKNISRIGGIINGVTTGINRWAKFLCSDHSRKNMFVCF